MPQELAQQLPVLQELLTDLGYRIVSCEGWEADDILGTCLLYTSGNAFHGYAADVRAAFQLAVFHKKHPFSVSHPIVTKTAGTFKGRVKSRREKQQEGGRCRAFARTALLAYFWEL